MLSDLTYPFQYSWHQQQEIAVIGWAFDVDNNYCQNNELAAIFFEVNNENKFKEVLQSLNGNFAVAIERTNFKAAAVDHIRSMPILFKKSNHSFELINNCNWQSDWELNSNASKRFEKCWCTLDNETLVKNIFQLQAGQYLWQSDATFDGPKFYYNHFQKEKKSEISVDVAAQLFQSVFYQYFHLLKDKTALIPLSGGYDSRLLLSLLIQYGHTDVIAYTYGKEDSHEVQIAKKVAQKLNVKWHFIPYNRSTFSSFFTDNWSSYSDKNHFLSSLPHEQDFFALEYLRSNDLLPKDFVVLPGFSGDLLGGSITGYHPKAYNSNTFEKMIREKHFQNAQIDYDFSGFKLIDSKDQFYDQYQNWFVNNKVTKFIVNSVRVYEYFGGSWLMPFWDKKLIEYWYHLPYEVRAQQQFYNDVIFQKFFEPLGINFKKPGHDDNYPNQIKEAIKQHLPSIISNTIKKVKSSIIPNDVNNLSVLNGMIQDRIIASNELQQELNNTHAIYFLQNLKK